MNSSIVHCDYPLENKRFLEYEWEISTKLPRWINIQKHRNILQINSHLTVSKLRMKCRPKDSHLPFLHFFVISRQEPHWYLPSVVDHKEHLDVQCLTFQNNTQKLKTEILDIYPEWDGNKWVPKNTPKNFTLSADT